MPAYAAMLLHINYAQIYASIIHQGLHMGNNSSQLFISFNRSHLSVTSTIARWLKEVIWDMGISKNCLFFSSG